MVAKRRIIKSKQPKLLTAKEVRKKGNLKSSRIKRNQIGCPALNPRSGEPISLADFYEAFVQGWGRIGRAADYLGCNRETTRMALRKYPELQAAVEEGEQLYTDMLEQVTQEEASLDKDSKRDTLRMFMLKKRKPKVYADRQDDNSQVMQDALAFVLDKSKNPAEYKQPSKDQ